LVIIVLDKIEVL